jgi:hypothetical protein
MLQPPEAGKLLLLRMIRGRRNGKKVRRFEKCEWCENEKLITAP